MPTTLGADCTGLVAGLRRVHYKIETERGTDGSHILHATSPDGIAMVSFLGPLRSISAVQIVVSWDPADEQQANAMAYDFSLLVGTIGVDLIETSARRGFEDWFTVAVSNATSSDSDRPFEATYKAGRAEVTLIRTVSTYGACMMLLRVKPS